MRAPTRVALATALAALAVVLSASTASADPRIGLSSDGTTWVEELTSPLATDAAVWVPGDSGETAFWVRNQSDRAVTGWVDVLVSGGTGELAHALALSTRLGDGSYVDGARSAAVTLQPGVAMAVSARVAFPPAVTDPATMLDVASVSWRVAFVADDVPAPPGPSPAAPPPAGGDAALPLTGEDVGTPLLVAGALLVLGAAVRGAAARSAAARRREDSGRA